MIRYLLRKLKCALGHHEWRTIQRSPGFLCGYSLHHRCVHCDVEIPL